MPRSILILAAVCLLQVGGPDLSAASDCCVAGRPSYGGSGCYVYYYYYYRGPRSQGPPNAFYPFDAAYLRSLRHNPGRHYYYYRSARSMPLGPAGGGASRYYERSVRVR